MRIRTWLACALHCLSLKYWKDPLDWLSIGSAQLFQGVLRSDHGLQFQLHVAAESPTDDETALMGDDDDDDDDMRPL